MRWLWCVDLWSSEEVKMHTNSKSEILKGEDHLEALIGGWEFIVLFH